MSVDEHRREAAGGGLRVALLTVSDTRTERTDKGGELLRSLVEQAGHRVDLQRIVPDERMAIRAAVETALALSTIEVVLVTGGTGLSPRDLTIEAVTPLFEREIPGFGELFRMLSFAAVGPAAMLSRASAGLVSGRAVFLLPGSPAAIDLALTRLILPELAHLLTQVRRPSSRPDPT